jgi:hypothetical protein
MSGLPGAIRHTLRRIPRRLRLHHLDRPAPLFRDKPQPHLHGAQEVTGKGTPRRAVGRHRLCHEAPRANRRDLRQRVEDPLDAV